jgi:hypothetical protein
LAARSAGRQRCAESRFADLPRALVAVLNPAAVGGVDFVRAHALPWLAAQLTIGQFYNPVFLRGYGLGVLNGSLWTIPLEQFCVLVPLLHRIFACASTAGDAAWMHDA